MKLEQDYSTRRQRLAEQAMAALYEGPDEVALRTACRTLLREQQVQEAESKQENASPEKQRRFQALAKAAARMAAELPADISIHTEADGRGYIDLASPLLVLDESCSAEAWQTFDALLCGAQQVWMDGSEGNCKLRFVF